MDETRTGFDPMNPLSAVHSMLLPQLESARTAQTGALEKLRAAHSGELPVEANDNAGRWGAIASGFSKAGPGDSIWQAIAQAGGEYGKELQRQFQSQRVGQQKAADLEFQDASKRLSTLESKYASALQNANRPGAQGRWVSRQVPGTGEVMLFNSMTGEERPLSSNQNTLLRSMEDRYLKAAKDAGYAGSEAIQFAKEQAAADAAQQAPTKFYQPEGAKQVPMQQVQQFPTEGRIEVAPTVDRKSMLPQLDADEKAAVAAGDYTRALELQKAKAALKTTPAAEAAPVVAKPVLADKRMEVKEKEAYGGKVGGHMADISIDLQKSGASAGNLIGDLNVMEKLFTEHGDDIPEGALAPYISSMKSGLKSLGVDVQGQGATDILQAIATKQALKAKTADGENLIPGPMTNWENQLLLTMSPGLAMSKEGRMLLIQLTKAQLEMKVKLAEAARNYIANHGRLDEQGWFDKATEIAKTNPYLNPRRLAALELHAKNLLKKGGK